MDTPESTPEDTTDDAFEAALALHKSGDFTAAAAAYRALLADNPEHGGALINLGHTLRRLGQNDEAEGLFQRATGLPEGAAAAWYNLGNLRAAKQDFTNAESAYRKALELEPKMAPAHFQLGCVFRDTRRPAAAIASFRDVAALDPSLTSAHMNLGNLLRAEGDLAAAAAAHRAALAQAPDSWEVHYNLARALEEAGDPAADTHLKRALEASPQPATVHHGFAEAASARQAFERAEEHYQAALVLEPNRPRARMGLGRAFARTGRTDQALREFAVVARDAANDIGLLSELATLEWGLKLRQEPIELLRRVRQLAPQHPDAIINLARALSSVWEIDECIRLCEEALAVDPNRAAAHLLKGYALVEMGRVSEGMETFRQAASKEAEKTAPNASLLFSSLYSDTLSADDVADLHRSEGAVWESQGKLPAEFRNPPDPDRKLRIAYLSPDFKGNHPVAIFLKPLLRQHDRAQFEIFGYSSPDYIDETTGEIAALTDHWRHAAGWSEERLARTIEADGIDILVDLAGLTAKTRVGALRHRPAPLQMCYIGYPHSTGLPFIDYLITDSIVAPPEDDRLFTEQPLRVDDCVFCFAPDDGDWPAIEPDIARQRKSVVFGSCNHVPKLTETTVALWARVLKAVPDSRLKLKAAPFADAGVGRRYRELFAAHGVDPSLLDLEGPSEFPELMATYRHIDIALDPVPYNGGTTTYQALWMGVPVVTLKGGNFCSRMGASILTHLGLEELIAETGDAYVETAVRLAADAPRRDYLRTTLRARIKGARSCDPAYFTANIEELFRTAWRGWCARRTA